eukprot:14884607-Ditylum_brightwellii.AAC.1
MCIRDSNRSKSLTPQQIKHVQKAVGLIIYYARAVDSTLSATLSSIASEQSKGMEKTEKATKQMLDYCHTHLNATLRFLANDMILTLHSDASYLSKKKAPSRAAGHFYLSNKNDKEFNNDAILTLSTIIRHVVASASEAELAALFYNAREAVPLR